MEQKHGFKTFSLFFCVAAGSAMLGKIDDGWWSAPLLVNAAWFGLLALAVLVISVYRQIMEIKAQYPKPVNIMAEITKDQASLIKAAYAVFDNAKDLPPYVSAEGKRKFADFHITDGMRWMR